MPIPNRELSQFGSFLYVDNTTRNIGIAVTTTPYVGIGTTNPLSKLHVWGDARVSGALSATSYYLNGIPLVSAVLQTWEISGSDVYRTNGNVGIGISVPGSKLTVIGDSLITGVSTANTFYGNLVGNITGNVTGVATTAINLTATSSINTSGIITATRLVSTVTGAAPLVVASNTQVTNLNASFLRGKTPPTNGDIVGTIDSQILSNKQISSSTLSSTTIDSLGIVFSGSTSGNTTLKASPIASGTLTLPSTTDTIVAKNTTDTLTNKTISASSNTISGITNINLSASAGILNTQLSNSTISGVSLGGNLQDLIAGSYINYSSGTTYNGSSSVTLSVNASTTNTANSIIARDVNGDFSAGSINCSNLTASFTISGKDFNSTSDVNYKTNIRPIKNALNLVSNLEGVKFDWKDNGSPSIGVIAQEVEKYIPELVGFTDRKGVNYNGLVAILIEAIKDLKGEVEELKLKINTK